jgi:hypothetical protein
VIALVLLLVVLLAMHHWVMEPVMAWGQALLELRALPWLAVAALAWLLAGPRGDRNSR